MMWYIDIDWIAEYLCGTNAGSRSHSIESVLSTSHDELLRLQPMPYVDAW